MNGVVDDQLRALIEISILRDVKSPAKNVTAWIDTAFDGHLVFPVKLIQDLQLETLAQTEAILADGQKVVLQSFLCYVNWFGKLMQLQVIANEGKFPLLGTGLLANRALLIDYAARVVSLT